MRKVFDPVPRQADGYRDYRDSVGLPLILRDKPHRRIG